MAQFNYAKVIATLGPSISKETVLAKIINNIDIFKISLSYNMEDTTRRYIDSIQKMDNSKTILLDLKGHEIKTRNDLKVPLKKGEKITVKYSALFTQDGNVIFLDYPNIGEIPKGTEISTQDFSIQITKSGNDELQAIALSSGTVYPNTTIQIKDYQPDLPFLSDKDKTDIMRGIRNNITVMAISNTKTSDDMKMLREFLLQNNGDKVKMFVKLDNQEILKDIEPIIDMCDGIIFTTKVKFNKNTISPKQIIMLCKKYGKPVIKETHVLTKLTSAKADKEQLKQIQEWLKYGIDAFILEQDTYGSEYPTEAVMYLYDEIIQHQFNFTHKFEFEDMHSIKGSQITNFIIHNAYEISKKINIKVIICPTENGYTPCRLSSLRPDIPIISFTKNDHTYRYLNTLWATKGYKIASGFDFTNLKTIGKEIIKIMHKGDIALDDKVLIVHSTIGQNMPNMINGIELYKFKDL